MQFIKIRTPQQSSHDRFSEKARLYSFEPDRDTQAVQRRKADAEDQGRRA